jgi:hypothetical protein
MGAGAWKIAYKAKKKIGNGTINLAGAFRMVLLKTIANLATISLLGSCVEVTEQFGYSSSGKTLASELWTVSSGGTAGTYMFDVGDTTWIASGGNITSVKAAAIVLSAAAAGGMHLLCYSTLTTSGAITISSGNSMTVQIASAGVFTMA